MKKRDFYKTKGRIATKDIDAIFEPKSKIFEISKEIAKSQDLPENWLNDSVKGYMREKAEYNTFLDPPALKVYLPIPGYIFAIIEIVRKYGWKHDFYIDYMKRLRNKLLGNWHGVPQTFVFDSRFTSRYHSYGYTQSSLDKIEKLLFRLKKS